MTETKKPNEAYHIAYLYSWPLVGKLGQQPLFPIPRLDLEKEKKLLLKSLATAKKAVRIKMDAANQLNLRTIVTMGCRALHYTGHGFKNCLAFEDTNANLGMMRALDSATLKSLFAAGGSAQDVKIVFVSACHSEPAGAAFVDAGVPHVIAVSRDAQVGDQSAQTFMYHFYLALLVGRTVKASFDIAKEAVKTESLRVDEAKKFLLLPENGNHEVAIFGDIDSGKWTDDTEPVPKSAIPALPETFLGRNVELQELLSLINSDKRRLITIHGEPGIGKTTMAIAAAIYLVQRKLFEGGVYFIPLSALNENLDENFATLISKKMELSPLCNTNQELFKALSENMPNILLIMDGAEVILDEEIGSTYCLRTFLNDLLLYCPKTKVLITSQASLSSGTNGGSRVVPEFLLKKLEPLSPIDAAMLFYELAPRAIQLAEFDCIDPQSAGQKLSQHEALKMLGGHPQKIFDAAQLLSGDKTMKELPALIRQQEEKNSTSSKVQKPRRVRKKPSLNERENSMDSIGSMNLSTNFNPMTTNTNANAFNTFNTFIPMNTNHTNHNHTNLINHGNQGSNNPNNFTTMNIPTVFPTCNGNHGTAHTNTNTTVIQPARTSSALSPPPNCREASRITLTREPSSEEKLARLIQDGRSVWKLMMMANEDEAIPWERCELGLNNHFSLAVQLQEHERKFDSSDLEEIKKKCTVKTLQDGKEVVTIDLFDKFFPWFSALEQAISMIKPMWITLKPRMIYGLLSRQRADELLKYRPVGTFIIRLSSQPGCFAVDFVQDDNSIGHVLISAQQSNGFTLFLQDGTVTCQSFPELMMKCRRFTFLYPDVKKNDAFSSEEDVPS